MANDTGSGSPLEVAVPSDRIAAVSALLKSLLDLRRLCALVFPMMKEVKQPRDPRRQSSRKTPRRTRMEPSGSFLVRLFEGGGADYDTRAEAEAQVDIMNRFLIDLVRNAVSDSLKNMIRHSTGAGSIDALKAITEELNAVASANSFRLQVGTREEGRARITPDYSPGAEVRFTGPKAEQRATDFCLAVNEILREHTAARGEVLNSQLKQALADL